jgi:hypothetical protein
MNMIVASHMPGADEGVLHVDMPACSRRPGPRSPLQQVAAAEGQDHAHHPGASAAQRNQNSASGAMYLADRRLQLGRDLRHHPDLHEVEIVQQPDPQDAETSRAASGTPPGNRLRRSRAGRAKPMTITRASTKLTMMVLRKLESSPDIGFPLGSLVA